MRNFYLSMLLIAVAFTSVQAQIFQEEITIPEGYAPTEVIMPPSPLSMQVLFVGGHDIVQTTPTYGNPAGRTIAKEWHDFIGFTPDDEGDDLGWVSVNHEQIYRDDKIGDGGGMTVFKVKRLEDGTLEVVEQTLDDGRQGDFFNVDFVNTVGETGMNCAGISSPTGRIWTAEEWFRSSQASISGGAVSGSSLPIAVGETTAQGVRDTSDYTISSDIAPFDGLTVKKYENFNYMVEIDPKQAVAIRKQYNWGRAGFEGGAISADDQTVYLGVDATPAPFLKFEATTPGDFTDGTLYVWKHDNPEGQRWIEVPLSIDNMMNVTDYAWSVGATMYNRNEWVAMDYATGIVYWTETGRDNPGGRWSDEFAETNAVFAPHHVARASAQGTTPEADDYWDYYGRVLYYDPATETEGVTIEGGPYFMDDPAEGDYPDKHLSNPDGLGVITIDGQSFLLIQEDLNGSSFGRTPADISNRLCEVYLLDLSTDSATVDDLVRLTAVPAGAEVTGGIMTPDGKSLLLNSQHPSAALAFPWNHSLTFAIHGLDDLTTTSFEAPNFEGAGELQLFPNPTTRVLHLSDRLDFAIYDNNGRRVSVYRNTNEADVSNLTPGMYYLRTEREHTYKFIVK